MIASNGRHNPCWYKKIKTPFKRYKYGTGTTNYKHISTTTTSIFSLYSRSLNVFLEGKVSGLPSPKTTNPPGPLGDANLRHVEPMDVDQALEVKGPWDQHVPTQRFLKLPMASNGFHFEFWVNIWFCISKSWFSISKLKHLSAILLPIPYIFTCWSLSCKP